MPAEVLVLVATAVLAVVAIGAAVVAVRASRRPAVAEPADAPAPAPQVPAVREPETPERVVEAQVVHGRVVVPPTDRDVVEATMGRPLVRTSIVLHGVAHALRPESRDRIAALVRREYRQRRRARQRIARRAARAVTPRELDRPTLVTDEWLGTQAPRDRRPQRAVGE